MELSFKIFNITTIYVKYLHMLCRITLDCFKFNHCVDGRLIYKMRQSMQRFSSHTLWLITTKLAHSWLYKWNFHVFWHGRCECRNRIHDEISFKWILVVVVERTRWIHGGEKGRKEGIRGRIKKMVMKQENISGMTHLEIIHFAIKLKRFHLWFVLMQMV